MCDDWSRAASCRCGLLGHVPESRRRPVRGDESRARGRPCAPGRVDHAGARPTSRGPTGRSPARWRPPHRAPPAVPQFPRRVHAPPYASWKVLDLRVDQCVALLASRRRPSLHRSDRGVGPARPAGEDSTTGARSGAGYAMSSASNVPVAVPPARPAAADRPCPAAAAPAETAACAESATICLATAYAARSISSSVECVRAPRERLSPKLGTLAPQVRG
jgi:hypothetical protein